MDVSEKPRKKRASLPARLLLGLGILGALGYMFVRSLETTRAEPYEVNRANLRGWELVLDGASSSPEAPVLILRTDIALVSSLFRQVFLRTMESMNTPTASTIPLVLRGEFDTGLAPRMSIDELLAAARDAGLETAEHTPACLVHRRISEPGSTRQAYGVLIDSPSITAFRARLAAAAAGSFDPAAVPAVMLVGASDEAFHRWTPWRATESDCVAPFEITGD
jgi:hypothetical protein